MSFNHPTSRPARRSFMAKSAIAVALAAAAATFATPSFAIGSLVDMQLVDRSQSEVLPIHPYRGASWVAGRPGSRYAVRLSNRSSERVLVVLSIDGVNALSGETAATGQTGYVLAPYQTTEIIGWRKSFTEAAAFYFTSLPDSYAARTDRPDNVGVVGLAVFREKREITRRPVDINESRMARNSEEPAQRGADADRKVDSPQRAEREKSAGAPPPAQSAAPTSLAEAARSDKASGSVMKDERLGTGHGEREYSPTTQTTFDRASDRPAEVVRLRYDSYENLLASGVLRPHRVPPSLSVPDPFPNFVPDPKG